MKIIALLSLMLLSIFVNNSLFAQKKEVIVVIDPGHGGTDPGHLSQNAQLLQEKDLNLLIAKELGGYLEKYLQNVKVVYTRTSDVFPSLNERVSLANRKNADYFISIHCNGNENKRVRGTETHVHTMSLKKSVQLATEIEKQFSKRAGRKSRGVKDMKDLKHTLQVLKYTNMTSVLVECGFLTNTKEANYLNSTYGQEIIASAIFRAFRTTIVKEFPKINFIPSKTAQNNSSSDSKSDYAIQIMSSKRAVDENDSSFKRLKMNVIRKKLNTTNAYKYIYLVGSYSTKSEARTALKQVKKRGFPDAIIVKKQ